MDVNSTYTIGVIIFYLIFTWVISSSIYNDQTQKSYKYSIEATVVGALLALLCALTWPLAVFVMLYAKLIRIVHD